MTVPVIMRAAPIATNAELIDHEAVRYHELYDKSALHPFPGREILDIPIFRDHFKIPIGRVTALRADKCWTGGMWWFVHAEIEDPPAWLRKGTPVSIGRSAYSTRTPWGAHWELIQRAILTEVSILSPGVKPAFPEARVMWLGEREHSPWGEVIYGDGTTLRRAFSTLITVRDGRGGVIVHQPDGSQLMYGSEADYQADVYALR